MKFHFETAGDREICLFGNSKLGPMDQEDGEMGIWEMRHIFVIKLD